MKVFETTGDWRIKEPPEQKTINALSIDNQINDPTLTKKNNKTVIQMAQCPRFDQCCAPICPIDTDWRERAHRKGEPVCAYLRRYAKDPLWGQKKGSVPTELWLKVVAVYPQVIARYGPLKQVLKRSSSSPFRTVITKREQELDKLAQGPGDLVQ